MNITENMSLEFGDKWEIPRSEIQLLNKLGEGSFGEVYYGKWRNMEIAAKTLKKGTMTAKDFLQEAAIMKKMKHTNVVQLYGVCSLSEPFYIIQEYVSNGCLVNYLRKFNVNSLKLNDLLYISYQIASGMRYLEANKFIHRDLAARNILVGSRNITKICDFGLARAIATEEYCRKKGSPFPVKWTAPEDIFYGKCSTKADVWSYGIVLMEIFTYGEVPYPGMSNKEVPENIKNGYRMPKPQYATDEIYNLMQKCWNYDPEKRPTFESIYGFFKK